MENILKKHNIFNEIIGTTQKDLFELDKEVKININELCKINNQWYSNY